MSVDADQEQTQIETETHDMETPDTQPDTQGSDSPSQTPEPVSGSAQQEKGVQQPQMIPKWRFDEINEQLKEERRARLQIQQPGNPQPAAQHPQATQPPKQEDFPTYEEFIRADAKFVAEQAAEQKWAALQQQSQKQTQQQQWQERKDKAEASFNEKLYEATTKNPALLQKLENAPTLRPDLQFYGLKEAEQPMVLAEYLADNPALVIQLNQMPPEKALRELGRIEGKLSGAPQQPPKVSQMPKPMTPIGGNKSLKGNDGSGAARALEILYPT